MKKLIKIFVEWWKINSYSDFYDGHYIMYQNDWKNSTNQKLCYFWWLWRLSVLLHTPSWKLDLEFRSRFLSTRIRSIFTKKSLKVVDSISDLWVKEFKEFIGDISKFLESKWISEPFENPKELEFRDKFI